MSLLDAISNMPTWAIAAHLLSIHEPPDVKKALAIANMVLAVHEQDAPSLTNLLELYSEADRLYSTTTGYWKRINKE